jgi:hypothetical protein
MEWHLVVSSGLDVQAGNHHCHPLGSTAIPLKKGLEGSDVEGLAVTTWGSLYSDFELSSS